MRGWRLVYGGAEVGLMGALGECCTRRGRQVVTGVIPQASGIREIAHRGLTELIETASMHERKAEMAKRADAFLVLPGGLGTLDEIARS